MNNPILLVQHAGYGETPECPEASFKRGDVVKVSRRQGMAQFPREAIIAVAVPRGFSPDWALADLVGEPRPAMAQVGARVVTYILVAEGDGTPYLARERDIRASGKPPVEIGSIKRAGSAA